MSHAQTDDQPQNKQRPGTPQRLEKARDDDQHEAVVWVQQLRDERQEERLFGAAAVMPSSQQNSKHSSR